MHNRLPLSQPDGENQHHLTGHTTGYEPAETAGQIDPAVFEGLVASEAWQNLTPNLPSPHDLLPADLDASQLALIGNTFFDPSFATKPSLWDGFEDLPKSHVIPGLGALDQVGRGETKACYRLTTEQGKKMAVLLLKYDNSAGLAIPEDPNLFQTSESATRRLWEYSDLRSYLSMPLGDGRTLKLQEFAEEGFTPGQSMMPGLTKVAARRALKNLASKNRPFIQLDLHTKPELAHPRHYLRKDGHFMPVAIDIPVVEQLD